VGYNFVRVVIVDLPAAVKHRPEVLRRIDSSSKASPR